ncbi:kinase-like domain-containing protein, partial [Fimicolochytrium jonesii]|uniref:kinase-like domain-containing protein n=1 Tax=Fimicolochytrium jonesii TaxID=1396493 RepID=UPI0022FE438D
SRRSSSSVPTSPSPGRQVAAGSGSRRYTSTFGPYLLQRTLGEGEFGKVKLAIHLDTGKSFAIKLMKKDSLDQQTTKRAKVMREISIFQTVSHPYIVAVEEVVETREYIGMVMEYASGGEMFEYVLTRRQLKEPEACKFMCQLLSGVAYLHNRKIVHRDLKLENLLLDGNRNVLITDFGFANRMQAEKPDESKLLLTSCGSPCYAAPELVLGHGYMGEAADIWSCGVILHAMLCGFLPYDDDPTNPDGNDINLLYTYITGTKLKFPDHLSFEAADLMSKMIVIDPSRRARMPEIMDHPFLEPY